MALWGILSNRNWSSDGSNESVCEVSRMKLWRSLSLAATVIFMLGTTKIKKWGSSYVEQAQQFSSPCCRRGNGMPFRCLESVINSFSLTAFSSRRLQLRWVWSSGASSPGCRHQTGCKFLLANPGMVSRDESGYTNVSMSKLQKVKPRLLRRGSFWSSSIF